LQQNGVSFVRWRDTTTFTANTSHTVSAHRSLRTIDAEYGRASDRLGRAAIGGGVGALVVLGFAAVAYFVDHAARVASGLTVCALTLGASAHFVRRGSRPAAVVLVLTYAAVSAWITWQSDIPMSVGPEFLFGAIVIAGSLEAFRIPHLIAEFMAAYVPKAPNPGEIWTVRDGGAFGVVKILSVEPDRVHVRQYGLRYPERPWHVKSSTLLRDGKQTVGQRFPHLPLDRGEFERWEPVFMREEALDPAELLSLESWQRAQGASATPSAPAR
jgi:hypothetical protein